MGKFRRFAIRFRAAGILFWLGSLAWAEPKLADVWRTVWLPFEVAEVHLQPDVCEESEQDFTACLYALSSVLASFPEPLTLIEAARLRQEPEFGKPIADFGTLKIVKTKPRPATKPSEVHALAKKGRERAFADWKRLYAARLISPVPLNQVIEYIKASDALKENEAWYSSIAINATFAVLRDPHTGITPNAASLEARDVRENRVYLTSGESGNVGYVRLAHFGTELNASSKICPQLREAVTSLTAKKVTGLILDLRDNPGGLVGQAACVANVFLNPGPKPGNVIVTTKATARRGQNKIYRATQPRATDLPLVTLINFRSASGSELVAGVLQDYLRSFILGERSLGKGSVQAGYRFSAEIQMLETVGRFYLPSGRSNQILSITPDIEVYPQPHPTDEERFALREEDRYLALPPVGKKWEQSRPAAVARLSECMATGAAIPAYEKAKSAGTAVDYPRLAAEDAVRCIDKLKLWDPTQAEPRFPEPVFEEKDK